MEGPCFNSETVDTAWLIIRGFLAPLSGKELCSASDIRVFRRHSRSRNGPRGIENALWTSKPSKSIFLSPNCLGGTQSEIKCGVSLGLQATPEVLLEKVAVELRAGYQRSN